MLNRILLLNILSVYSESHERYTKYLLWVHSFFDVTLRSNFDRTTTYTYIFANDFETFCIICTQYLHKLSFALLFSLHKSRNPYQLPLISYTEILRTNSTVRQSRAQEDRFTFHQIHFRIFANHEQTDDKRPNVLQTIFPSSNHIRVLMFPTFSVEFVSICTTVIYGMFHRLWHLQQPRQSVDRTEFHRPNASKHPSVY